MGKRFDHGHSFFIAVQEKQYIGSTRYLVKLHHDLDLTLIPTGCCHVKYNERADSSDLPSACRNRVKNNTFIFIIVQNMLHIPYFLI